MKKESSCADFGLLRIGIATPRVYLADVRANVKEALSLVDRAVDEGVSVLCFPELNLTGYTCADLFGQKLLLDEAEGGVAEIAAKTKSCRITLIVGVPVHCGNDLYNCAAVLSEGEVKGLVPKTYLPTYSEFYEARWFTSGDGVDRMLDFAGFRTRLSARQLFTLDGRKTFGVEICEDLWTPLSPSTEAALAGAQVIFNLSASNEVLGKHAYRRSLVSSQSSKLTCAYAYASAGYGESTQDLVFGGSSMICEYGTFMAENDRFQMGGSLISADIDVERLDFLRAHSNTFTSVVRTAEYETVKVAAPASTDFNANLRRHVEVHPFVPQGDDGELDIRCREITAVQVLGLATRLEHIHCKTAVIGISGGLDSTLALLVTAMAFDRLGWSRERIIGVTMPGFGTTGRTYNNSLQLMRELGVSIREVSIVPAVLQHFSDVGQDKDKHDTTYENCQARERTQVLMDIAGATGGIVIGTGDLSELALGWCTYNGDHMSMYAVNCSIPKTLVRTLVAWGARNSFPEAAKTLLDIIDTPISPELVPAAADGTIAQKTEDLVGPYELHDFFLYNFFRCGYRPSKIRFLAGKAFDGTYDSETIDKWLRTFIRRFFSQQFKRSCIPDGPKVGTVSLSPRGDWRMPSDANAAIWLSDLD